MDLPSGWEMKVDARTKRSYFLDHTSKVTTWEDPRKSLRYASQVTSPTPVSQGSGSEKIELSYLSRNSTRQDATSNKFRSHVYSTVGSTSVQSVDGLIIPDEDYIQQLAEAIQKSIPEASLSNIKSLLRSHDCDYLKVTTILTKNSMKSSKKPHSSLQRDANAHTITPNLLNVGSHKSSVRGSGVGSYTTASKLGERRSSGEPNLLGSSARQGMHKVPNIRLANVTEETATGQPKADAAAKWCSTSSGLQNSPTTSLPRSEDSVNFNAKHNIDHLQEPSLSKKDHSTISQRAPSERAKSPNLLHSGNRNSSLRSSGTSNHPSSTKHSHGSSTERRHQGDATLLVASSKYSSQKAPSYRLSNVNEEKASSCPGKDAPKKSSSTSSGLLGSPRGSLPSSDDSMNVVDGITETSIDIDACDPEKTRPSPTKAFVSGLARGPDQNMRIQTGRLLAMGPNPALLSSRQPAKGPDPDLRHGPNLQLLRGAA